MSPRTPGGAPLSRPEREAQERARIAEQRGGGGGATTPGRKLSRDEVETMANRLTKGYDTTVRKGEEKNRPERSRSRSREPNRGGEGEGGGGGGGSGRSTPRGSSRGRSKSPAPTVAGALDLHQKRNEEDLAQISSRLFSRPTAAHNREWQVQERQKALKKEMNSLKPVPKISSKSKAIFREHHPEAGNSFLDRNQEEIYLRAERQKQREEDYERERSKTDTYAPRISKRAADMKRGYEDLVEFQESHESKVEMERRNQARQEAIFNHKPFVSQASKNIVKNLKKDESTGFYTTSLAKEHERADAFDNRSTQSDLSESRDSRPSINPRSKKLDLGPKPVHDRLYEAKDKSYKGSQARSQSVRSNGGGSPTKADSSPRRNSFMDEDGDVMHGHAGYSRKEGHAGLNDLKKVAATRAKPSELAEKDMEVYKALWGKDHPDAGSTSERM